MGKCAHKVGTIILVVAVGVVAIAAGRMSTNLRPIDGDAFERACREGNELEVRGKIEAEFRQAQQAWEARYNRYQWPVHAAVFRTFEQPNIEAYMAQVAAMREDYPALIKRRAECARQSAARR